MSIIEDLRNTEITDTAFYLFFVLALTAPGTAYALYFYLDVFKELDSWKAFFMIVAISAPPLVIATLSMLMANLDYFVSRREFKLLGFVSSLVAIMADYLTLAYAVLKHWDFMFTSLVAVSAALALGILAGVCSRFE